MKNYCILIFLLIVNFGCNNVNKLQSKKEIDKYIRTYFKLSEQNKFEQQYPIYLDECDLFYKIKSPTKALIQKELESYWVRTTQTKNDIKQIEINLNNKIKEVFVTMDYSYLIIKDSVKRFIPNLKLKIILNNKNKFKEIYEISRG